MQGKLLSTRRQFFAALLVCLAILAAGNLVVQRLTAHTVSRRLVADARAASSAQIIALGNSLMRSGFVPEAFAPPVPPQEQSPAFNLAMGASTPVEQLLLLRACLGSFSKTRLLLYCFYDFQLTEAVTLSNADLIGNHDILYYQESRFARRYFSMTPYESAAFEATRRLPMLAERGAVWARSNCSAATSGGRACRPKPATSSAVSPISRCSKQKAAKKFERHCAVASQAELNAAVAEIIREAQERGMQVVFIVMPLPPRHVETFYDTPAWKAYQRHIEQLLAISTPADGFLTGPNSQTHCISLRRAPRSSPVPSARAARIPAI
jgi:hypothetical protein